MMQLRFGGGCFYFEELIKYSLFKLLIRGVKKDKSEAEW